MSITLEEAKAFLEKTLQFKNWNEILKGDQMEFLRVIMAHYHHHTYFQNISMTAVFPNKRKVPNAEDTKSIGFEGVGGACIIQNGFLAILLKAIGFNSYVISSFVRGLDFFPDNHVICVVQFSPDEKYILDVGTALPFAEPIAMHKLPYTQTAAGLRYQYKANENVSGTYDRVQLDGSLFGRLYEDKTLEFLRMDFTMTPQLLDFFQQPLTAIFTIVDESFFLRQPYLFRYFEEDENGNLVDEVNVYGNRKWILIRGVSVLIADDLTKTVNHYSTYDEVKEAILKYFPKLPKDDVEKAIGYFNETVPKYGFFKAK